MRKYTVTDNSQDYDEVVKDSAVAAAPAPATKVGMEEGCITAKAADIPMKKCVLPSICLFFPFVKFPLS